MQTALDSGAFTLYRKSINDPSFYASEKFGKYLGKYIEWLKENKSSLGFYATLDVMYNPDLSWKLYNVLRKEGLSPMPIVHYGTNTVWLKKYLPTSDYIGLGGIAAASQTNTAAIQQWVGNCFKYVPKDTKLHGYGISSSKLIDFPWHSVDSTSAFYQARCGWIYATGMKGTPYIFGIGKNGGRDHIDSHSVLTRQRIEDELSHWDLSLEELRDSKLMRSILNGLVLQSFVEGRGIRYYFSGDNGSKELTRGFLDGMYKRGKQMKWLGTFAKLDMFNMVRTHGTRTERPRLQHKVPTVQRQGRKATGKVRGAPEV